MIGTTGKRPGAREARVKFLGVLALGIQAMLDFQVYRRQSLWWHGGFPEISKGSLEKPGRS